MKRILSRFNPMLVNLIIGSLICFVAGELILAVILNRFFPEYFFAAVTGFAVGNVMNILRIIHMYWGIVGSVSYGEEKSAWIHSGKMYVIRTVAEIALFILILFILGMEGFLFTMIGMMSLKVAAYLQPFTDKFLVSKIYK